MKTVFIMSDDNDQTYLEIIGILKNFGFNIIDPENTHITQNNRFAIKIKPNLNISAKNATLLVLNKRQTKPLMFNGSLKGICESSNQNALNILKLSNILTIVCGTSNTDTITFSSITNNKALISIQRQIKTTNGKIIEPCEIPITINHKFSNSAVICACSVLILNDIHITEL